MVRTKQKVGKQAAPKKLATKRAAAATRVPKKVVAKKVAPKKVAAKGVPAKKAAAKKAAAKKTLSAADETFSIGDVVLFVGDNDDVSEAGRVCRVLNFDRYCVQFSGMGCKRTPGSSLRRAPSGTDAPDCGSCSVC